MVDIERGSVTRRHLLSGAAAAGVATAAAPLLAGPAAAAEVAAGTTTATAQDAIKHIVFLMLENRSFDHLFGTLSGVRGFDDRSVTRPDGGSIFAQYDPVTEKYELPFRLSESNDGQGDADLSHNWGPQHISLNNGTNDNWIKAHRDADGPTKGPFTMAYFTRDDVPYHYALADTFTVCDNYFCSVLGPTYPNRLLWQMGSLDADAKGGGPLLTTDESVFTDNNGMGVFDYPTYPERLTAAGVTWQAYTDAGSNHLLNMFPAFTQYNKPAGSAADMTNYTSGTQGTSQGGFLTAVETGTLPDVSWIFPTAQSTEHPGDGPINAGPQYYEPIITALMKSPSWANTVLLLTYDENDGYFDHVPPPGAPAGTPGEYLKGPAFGSAASSTDPTTGKTTSAKDPSDGISGPVGLGFRVPNLVISPFSRGGKVNSELFDHTSCLKLVETVFGVSPKGIVSDWRYNLVGDLTSTMDFSNPDTSAAPAALAAAFAASQQMLTPMGTETVPADGVMPVQETTPVRPRIGPNPDFAQPPASVMPEVATPALLVAAGLAAATGAIAARRIRAGGKGDATHAGAHLAAPAPATVPADEQDPA